MKRRAFWMATWALVFSIVGMVAADALSETLRNEDILDAEIVAGMLGAGAGVLAILFQRRAEFVASLRMEWASCLEAIAAVRLLYIMTEPDERAYLHAFSKVSIAIDGMRSVYRNHGESWRHIGYYPYSTLHDIRIFIAEDFGKGRIADAESRARRLLQIDGCWRLFRRRFLSELETPEADRPVLARAAEDRRKRGIPFWRRPFMWRAGRVLEPKDVKV